MAALYFLLPTGDSRSGRRSLIPNSSPFSRSTRFPFTSTPSPPASLPIRKAPSASVESIEPRPPRPCEVGRPKGRRRDRKSVVKGKRVDLGGRGIIKKKTPWGGSPPRPLCQKICYSDCTENCPLSPLRAPRRFRNPRFPFTRNPRFPFTSTASPPASLPIRKAPSASVESIQPRPPRPCEVGRPKGRRRKNRRQSHKFFKHRRSAVRNPYSRGRLGPAKSED